MKKNNPMKRPEIKEKVSKKVKGKPNLKNKINTRLSWQKKEFWKKQMKARHTKPNKAELKLGGILKPFGYKFIGDGKKILGGKNPDFINCNGEKKIIELFGNYWHGEKITGNTKKQEERERKGVFAKYGYETLIVWENELKDETALIERIKVFQ